MTNTNAADGGARSVHTLSIDKRRHAAITGVTDVCSFHETEVVLKIAKLLLEDGRLEVDGHIDGIIYESPKTAARRAFAWKWLKK